MSDTTFHQPKGSMCSHCNNKSADCSHLPFHLMQPIHQLTDKGTGATTTIVKCSRFVKQKGN